MLLAIETATRQMGVAVIDGGAILSSYELLADYPHAVELPGAVRRVLASAGTSLKQLDGIAIDIGPGSFTGLRIGLAFVKALAFASQKPVVAAPSFEVLAAAFAFAPHPVAVVLDARQKNVYACRYSVGTGTPVKQEEFFLGPIGEWLAKQKKEPVILVGDGCAPYRREIAGHFGDAAHFAAADACWPRAGILARLGAARLEAGQKEDAARLIPLYLYPLDCSVRGPNRPTSVLPKIEAPML